MTNAHIHTTRKNVLRCCLDAVQGHWELRNSGVRPTAHMIVIMIQVKIQ